MLKVTDDLGLQVVEDEHQCARIEVFAPGSRMPVALSLDGDISSAPKLARDEAPTPRLLGMAIASSIGKSAEEIPLPALPG